MSILTPDTQDPAPSPSVPESFADVPRFTSVAEAQSQPQGHLVGLCARVVRVEQVKGHHHRGARRIRLQDLDGREHFETMPLSGAPHLIAQAWDAVEHGYPVIAFGSFPQYDRKHPRYDGPDQRMELCDLRQLTNQTSLLCPSQEELAEIDALLDRLWATPGGFCDHVIEAARRHAGVAADFLPERYRLGEEITVLQALSYGMVNPSLNSRISVFVLSGPGTGKDKLARYVDLFAPFCQKIQPVNVTPAGLGTAVSRGKDSWQANPGALPMASLGACVLDDMHRLERKNLNQIQGLLMNTLEEGAIRPVKAAICIYDARCALFITSNMASLRDRMEAAKQLTPQARAFLLGLPFDLFSRFDFTLNLGSGDDTIRSAMKIGSQAAFPEYPEERDENRRTPLVPSQAALDKRRIKLLFTRAKDRIPKVDVSGVEGQIEDGMLRIGVLNRAFTARLKGADEAMFDGDGLVRRQANSVRKFIGALARSEGRSVAEPRDVERALELLSPKLEILRWVAGETDQIRPLPPLSEQMEAVRAESEQRWQKLMAVFAGLRVQVWQVMEALGCSELSARRELSKRGVEPQGTWYQIPTAAEYQRTKAENDRLGLRAELVKPPKDEGLDRPPPPPEPPPVKIWDDSLLSPPRECDPVLAQLGQMDEATQLAIIDRVYDLVLRENATSYRPLLLMIISLIVGWWEDAGVPLPVAALEALQDWLLAGAEDWTTRGLKVMGLYGDSALVERLRALLKREKEPPRPGDTPLPDKLAAGLEDLKTRLRWEREERKQALLKEAGVDQMPPWEPPQRPPEPEFVRRPPPAPG